MNIARAIDVDISLMAAPVLKDNPTIIDALSLSVEALKAVQKFREDNLKIPLFELPGETEV